MNWFRRSRTLRLAALTSLLAACAASPATTNVATGTPGSASPVPATPSSVVAATPAATAFPVPAFGPAPSGALPASTERQLRDVIEAAVTQHDGLGVTAAVLKGDVGMWSIVAGKDRSGNTANAHTRWSTGSIGKTVVAAQVLRLVEDGRLLLDAPASTYLQASDGDANGATIRQLLRMRSGIPGGVAPDTKFEYAEVDYVFLGRVLQRVEGRPLGEVLTNGVLHGAGADGLRFPSNGTVSNAAGPLETDALSLARWGEALFRGRIVKASSIAAMTAFDADEYGMGLFDLSADFGRPTAGHLGVDEPASAALVILPEDGLVVAVLANPLDWQATEAIAVALAKAALQ